VAAGVIRAGAPIAREPGVVYRLSAYLTQHRVSTTSVSIYPERELTAYHRPVETVFDAALATARDKGWEIQALAREEYRFKAIARTPVWRFKDHIEVRITRREDKGTSALHISAESELGIADLGQNTAHLITLREGVEQRL
jgi:hypothetical protein